MRDAAPLLDVLTADLAVIARSRAYHLLDLEVVQQTLARTPDQVSTHPESGMTRALYDCTSIPLASARPTVRLIVATHPATGTPSTVGVERDGTIYELFVNTLPSPAFTASDVLDLYLHRGSFETVLADEDDEQEFDRWYLHTPVARSSPRSSHNGFGIFDWNWGNSSLKLSCVRPNLLQRARQKLPQPTSLNLRKHLRLRSCMAHRNGHVYRLRMVSPALRLRRNPMGRCVALPTTRCIFKSGVPSGMTPCGCCMPHASAIAVPVPCVRSRKRAVPRSSRDA